MKKIILLFLICLIGCQNHDKPSKDYIIASGSRGGNYYNTGEFISNQYGKKIPDATFTNIETNGSNDNIELLKENAVDFAIVQRNVLINKIYDEGKGIKNIKVIAPLFEEKLLIYYHGRQNISIDSLNSLISTRRDTLPLKIGYTKIGSYSHSIFKKMGTFLDIDFSRTIDEETNNYEQLVKRFKANKLDIIVSFSLPIPEIESDSLISKMYLSERDADIIHQRFTNVFKSYVNKVAEQYTIGSWSFLIGSKKSIQEIDSEKVLYHSLYDTISDSTHQSIHETLKKGKNDFAKINPNTQLKGIPLTPTLKSETKLFVVELESYLIILLFIILGFLIHYATRGHFFPKLDVSWIWRRYKYFKFGLLALISIYFLSVWILLDAERRFYTDLGIKSPILNMNWTDLNSWILITTVTGNSNDIFPLSLLGKIMLALNSLNFWIGTIFIGVSEYINYNVNKKRKQGIMETKHTNHLVIFGWNRHTESFILEILQEAKEYDQKISIVCVVPDISQMRAKHKKMAEYQDNKKIDIIEGDALDFHVLELARVEDANSIVLLSESNTKVADERTVLRAHSISRYTMKKRNEETPEKKTIAQKASSQLKKSRAKFQRKKSSYRKYSISKEADITYMIAELNHEEHREALLDAGVNEIVVSGNYRKATIKQSLFNHGISKVLDEIMLYNGHNELYKVNLSEEQNSHLHGKTYDELLGELRTHGILLIGIQIIFKYDNNDTVIDKDEIKALLAQNYEGGITSDIIINPSTEIERKRPVMPDDHLIVMADNYKHINEGIQKIKSILNE